LASTYVKRINEEIVKEKAEIKEFVGTEDEDLVTARGNAVVAWFETQLATWTERAA
jgi:hypothetical protein